MKRHDGRKADELRPIKITRNFTKHAGGSVVIAFGDTRVLCTAMIEKDLPPWLRSKNQTSAKPSGWLTAEYGMLPSSTTTRKRRDSGKPDGRSVEIQRLVGRALRSVIDLEQLITPGEKKEGVTLFVDCDVLQADGGTRTASICGGYVALHDAITRLVQRGVISEHALSDLVAAVSVGVVGGIPMLDLPYEEDSRADTDMNVVMTGGGAFVEVQGTAEHQAFTRAELDELLDLAAGGIERIHEAQRAILAAPLAERS